MYEAQIIIGFLFWIVGTELLQEDEDGNLIICTIFGKK